MNCTHWCRDGVSPYPLHAETVTGTASMALWPDLRNGRGNGCAMPFSSIVRLRSVYSPAGRPGSNATQWTLHNRIGQARGWPVAGSKPIVPAGIRSTLRHYTNLSSMANKIERLLQDFQFTTLSGVSQQYPKYHLQPNRSPEELQKPASANIKTARYI